MSRQQPQFRYQRIYSATPVFGRGGAAFRDVISVTNHARVTLPVQPTLGPEGSCYTGVALDVLKMD